MWRRGRAGEIDPMTTAWSIRVRWTRASLVILVLGCNEATGVGGTLGTDLSEDRGVAVGASWGSLAPVWSAVSNNLYFQGMVRPASGPPFYRFEVVDASNNVKRVLTDSSLDQITHIALAPDEQSAYLRESPPSAERPWLQRVLLPAGNDELLAPRLTNALAEYNEATAPMIVSPEGTHLAYVVFPDSLHVRALATGESRFVTAGCMGLAAFSPDSDEVLCASPSFPAATYALVRISNAASTPIVAPNADVLANAMGFRWDDGGIRVVYFKWPEVFVADLRQQTTRQVPPLSGEGVSGISTVAWSGDGTTMAFWRWRCLDFGLKACDSQYTLTVLDVETWTVRRSAVVNVTALSGDSPSRPALSSDGTRVAYQAHRTLYLKSTLPVP